MGGDLFGLFVILVVVLIIFSNILRRVKETIRQGGSESWKDLTPVEPNVRRELERRIREAVQPEPAQRVEEMAKSAMERAMAERRAAAPPPVPQLPPAPIPAPARAAREAAAQPQPHRRAAAPPPHPVRRTPPVKAASTARGLRLNPRTMARIAILSEIWRPPVALRKEEPWERS